jgi:hypothetical protein
LVNKTLRVFTPSLTPLWPLVQQPSLQQPSLVQSSLLPSLLPSWLPSWQGRLQVQVQEQVQVQVPRQPEKRGKSGKEKKICKLIVSVEVEATHFQIRSFSISFLVPIKCFALPALLNHNRRHTRVVFMRPE